MKPTRERRCGRSDSTWKDEMRDSVQSRNIKDEECSDRELLKKNVTSLG
jgi:hypothetical protein